MGGGLRFIEAGASKALVFNMEEVCTDFSSALIFDRHQYKLQINHGKDIVGLAQTRVASDQISRKKSLGYLVLLISEESLSFIYNNIFLGIQIDVTTT